MATYAETRAMYPILRHFEYGHLRPDLQGVSKPLCDLAWEYADTESAAAPEVAVGLRKLLEAKDCFVRAAALTQEPTG